LKIKFLHLFFFLFCLGISAQEIILPTKKISIGNRTHTSRDVLQSSQTDSDGNIYLIGHIETDFSYNDIQIIKLDQDLNEIWKKSISFDTRLSFDRVVSSFIDENDNITLVCKSAFNKYTESPVVLKLDKNGIEIWRWTLEDLSNPIGMQGFDLYTAINERDNIILGFKQNSLDHSNPYKLYEISPSGELLNSYPINHFDNQDSRTITPFVYNTSKYHQMTSETNPNQPGLRTYYRTRFDEDGIEKEEITLNNRQKIIVDRANSELLYDEQGNSTWITYHTVTIGGEHLLGYSLYIFENETTDFNYVESSNDIRRDVIGRGFDTDNNIILISESRSLDNSQINGLLMEKFNRDGELIAEVLQPLAVTGYRALFKNEKIIVQAADKSLLFFNDDFQLLNQVNTNLGNVINHIPIDIHTIGAHQFISGIKESSMYEGSDFLSQKDFNLKKIQASSEIKDYTYSGLGTSKTWLNWVNKESNGEYRIHLTDKIGPDNPFIGGSRGQEYNHYYNFDSNLNQLSSASGVNRVSWTEPSSAAFKPFELDGSTYKYSASSTNISLSKDGEILWNIPWNIGNTSYANEHRRTSTGNLFFYGSNGYGSTYEVYKLTKDGELTFIDYQGSNLYRFEVLENDWIFTHTDRAFLIYSPDLKLISQKESLDARTYSQSNYAPSLQIGNRVLFSTGSNLASNFGLSEMHVYDQYGNLENTFLFQGNLRARYAFVDKNDLIVLTDEGGFVDHGFSWTIATLNKYENFVGDILTDNSTADFDNDGVPNAYDQCENTPEGNLVNELGCNSVEPSELNFITKTIGSNCFGRNTGEIHISAVLELNYSVTLTLNDIEVQTENFQRDIVIDKLESGNYEVCIKVEGNQDYKQCYILNVSEPTQLYVSSKVSDDKRNLELNLDGGDIYIININDEIFTTSDNNLSLELKHPFNSISIKTNKDCQGVFEKNIIVSEESHLYPNPTNGVFSIYVGANVDQSLICHLYNAQGQLLEQRTIQPQFGSIAMDISAHPNGQYYFIIAYLGNNIPYKVIKE